jgi:glucose-1-phosphate cytidylyltransferase
MKVIILAGGFGTRISEETENKPKPMVLIDHNPIIWHVMNIYASQGFVDFVIATGYRGDVIKEWVSKLSMPWNVEALDTGLETQTAGRVRQALEYIDEDACLVTYGDGVGNVNIKDLLDFHRHHGRVATVTAVRPPARFGVIQSSNGVVTEFGEKNQADAGWINGGFFVLDRKVLEKINSDNEPFESEVLPRLVRERQLMAFHHNGFWQPMDTLREKNELASLASAGNPPWIKL